MTLAAVDVGLQAGLGRLWLAVTVEGSPPATPTGRTGGAVIARLQQREPEEWRRLFEEQMPAIYRYALARLGNASEAEDAASAVFAQAYESADRLEDRGLPPRAWLFGVAKHVVGTRRRQLVRQPAQLDLQAFDETQAGTLQMDPDLLDLAHAVRGLSRKHAEVVMLRFVHGLSLQETADVLRVSVDSVKGRQARALSELRSSLLGTADATG